MIYYSAQIFHCKFTSEHPQGVNTTYTDTDQVHHTRTVMILDHFHRNTDTGNLVFQSTGNLEPAVLIYLGLHFQLALPRRTW